ncbi:MAG: hypothetical protein HC781_05040 [Leptolyngbyaceae cyanobacterium CSU_1_4]|nr:hypothetical protein [Leptolyngbyaceae cyanobacterium CSU_1_4]
MNYLGFGFLGLSLVGGMAIGASAQPESLEQHRVTSSSTAAEQLDLDPQILESSPVLQRWSEEIPDVLFEIRNDPSFRTKVRVGYSFYSNEQESGVHLGIEDVFVSKTHLTLSADYQAGGNGSREAYGGELRYYALPLGSSVNVAPIIGYRWLESDRYNIDGANLGLRLQLQLSRTGASDITLAQSWVNPGSETEEVGMTTLTFGYALTPNLRLSTDLQQQNAPEDKDRRLGIGLEWML